MKHSPSLAARCKRLALALALTAGVTTFAHAAGTSLATDAAPRAHEIEWIDLSEYDHALASAAAGQSFSISLLDGRQLSFQLKHVNAEPPQTANTPPLPSYGVDPSPIAFANASFGRTGYVGITGSPIIFGRRQGTVTLTNIRVSDTDGRLFAFEWVAADAESTGHSATRHEFIEFMSNGAAWSQVASLSRPADSAPNPGTLTVNGAPSVARIQTDAVTTPEGGAFVLATANPTSITFTYGSDMPGEAGSIASRQAAAFGIVAHSRIIGSTRPAPVPVNHPLALALAAMLLGLLAFRKFRAG